MVEQNNDTTKNITAKFHGQKIAEFRSYEGPNLAANENIKNIKKRKTRDSNDELENPKFNNIIKKNRFHKEQTKVILKMQVHKFINILMITDIIFHRLKRPIKAIIQLTVKKNFAIRQKMMQLIQLNMVPKTRLLNG